jgi:hypothetical protein
MKQALFTLFFAATSSVASAYLPYTDESFHPNPLQKTVHIVATDRPCVECINRVTDQSGVVINLDKDSIRKAGVNINQKVKVVRVNCPAIDMVYHIVEQIDPDEKLAVFYEEDGSLTIAADE